MTKKLFVTHAECVSAGHPDKVADAISDAVVDLFLSNDSNSHVACETLVTRDSVILSGEINSQYQPSTEEIETTVRAIIASIGYKDNLVDGFDASTVVITNSLTQQSSEISQGVDVGGAGDQGVMYGSATNETESHLPLAQKIALDLMVAYDYLLKSGNPYLKPDAKSQVVVNLVEGQPEVKHITLAMSHKEDCTQDKLKEIAQFIITTVLTESGFSESTPTLTINGTGSFCHCGPAADAGLTGRKIVVDQVAGGLVGGGAFSGKDPSKVDRSAAYYARYIANHLVVAGVCDAATVGISYTIGQKDPDAVTVQLTGNKTSFTPSEISNMLLSLVTFEPREIRAKLGLLAVSYHKYCNYSHYCDGTAPWEVIDTELVKSLQGTLL